MHVRLQSVAVVPTRVLTPVNEAAAVVDVQAFAAALAAFLFASPI